MNSRRRIRDLPRWIAGAYREAGSKGTGYVEACRWLGGRITDQKPLLDDAHTARFDCAVCPRSFGQN
jgi:hypothetical protein